MGRARKNGSTIAAARAAVAIWADLATGQLRLTDPGAFFFRTGIDDPATWSDEQFQFAFDDLDAEKSPINYVSFAKGTVIPDGASTAGASGHRNTWRIAYTIEPVRDWVLRWSR
ncbi:hypothetical protein [Consotaella aegiceratis]|uniref:hypothetical protein n=1 Tax=Consotaella aegiceratis TaxID=3097961 RepID=UPI002F3F484B